MKVRKDGWLLDEVTNTWYPPKKKDDETISIPETIPPVPVELKKPEERWRPLDSLLPRWYRIQ